MLFLFVANALVCIRYKIQIAEKRVEVNNAGEYIFVQYQSNSIQVILDETLYIEIGTYEIPIGEFYKESVFKRLG